MNKQAPTFAAFDPVLAFIVNELEGGGKFHKVAGDPGGATKWGISLRFLKGLDRFATEASIKALTYEDAYKLYVANFWLQIQGPSLPPVVAAIVLDEAINQGVAAARRDLRTALGLISKPTAITPDVLFEARRQDGSRLYTKLLQLRLNRYMRGRGWPQFGKGWKNRLKRLAAFLNIKPSDQPLDLQ